MTPTQLKRLEGELESFLGSMFSGLGRTERRRAMDWYVKGLLLEGDSRRSGTSRSGCLSARWARE
ncbi:hypothetical protein BHS09_09000 [Myxococcus xanthus]|uniref:Uncharacterized protein n=1 Tax=Myxococcus xanthus TaxID=34 RepID=A0AAE6FY27_MYXXA|nr:hypothetical protein BHS09_09000 [Myxococcus xanthus]QDE74401.1 hypothetical protein BHS08_09010 [Myxococcus xanthus]